MGRFDTFEWQTSRSDEFTEGLYGDFSLGDWYFGGIPGLNDFNGSIDDARIYSSALTDEYISLIYNGGAETWA